jgi:Zn-dependent protease
MSGFSLGRIAGIDVHVHPTWFIILLLVVWMLARSALPAGFPDLGSTLRLVMAVAIALAFFVSLLIHELAHSLVAMARGIPVHRITFFLFGGMAQTTRESRTPGEEFLIAIAGPAASFLLAGIFTGLWWYGVVAGWSPVVAGSAGYVGALNLVLAIFNLLPGFPMDGGRILRSVIWKASGDLTLATLWAARVGVGLALLLVGYGILRTVDGQFLGGVWLVLIGLFIRNAARGSYQQHVISRARDTAGYGWEGGVGRSGW